MSPSLTAPLVFEGEGEDWRLAMDRIRAALRDADPVGGNVTALKASIEAAIALILEEHQDWHLLVRPHSLPLA